MLLTPLLSPFGWEFGKKVIKLSRFAFCRERIVHHLPYPLSESPQNQSDFTAGWQFFRVLRQQCQRRKRYCCVRGKNSPTPATVTHILAGPVQTYPEPCFSKIKDCPPRWRRCKCSRQASGAGRVRDGPDQIAHAEQNGSNRRSKPEPRLRLSTQSANVYSARTRPACWVLS